MNKILLIFFLVISFSFSVKADEINYKVVESKLGKLFESIDQKKYDEAIDISNEIINKYEIENFREANLTKYKDLSISERWKTYDIWIVTVVCV